MKNPMKLGTIAAVFVTFGTLFSVDSALATKKIYSPIVEYHEFEFEARGNYGVDNDSERRGVRKQKYAVGYGVLEHLFVEAYGEVEKSGDSYEFEAVELESRYQVFEHGEHWLDLGLYASYEFALENGNADKLETKLLLQRENGRFLHRANLILEREVGSNAADEFEGGVAWSTRYRLRRGFEPGVEYHSDFGDLGNVPSFNDQKHLAGLVVYGRLGKIKYDIGYLIGVSDASQDGMFKWIVEYEFYF